VLIVKIQTNYPMSKQEPPLEKGKFYHIYNRGVNSCNLFKDSKTYEHFLNLYDKYISPVAGTYAWVLMPNHFHLLVRIKENVVYKYTENADRSVDAVRFEELKWETLDLSTCEASDSVTIATTKTNNIKIPKAHLHFSHLFNAYSKYFNTYTGRHGSLFERSFDRIEIADKEYFKNLVVYIHNNPDHHRFTEYAMDYPWSSYLTCISIKPTHLQRDEVIGWFDSAANFKTAHDGVNDIDFNIEVSLGLD
jgi:REP element-mobilizing transposase RayT